MRRVAILLMALLLGCTGTLQAGHKHPHPEKYYQEQWCNEHHGVMEYRLEDRTRVDCLTDEFAIEFDFGTKWAESVGQSLYYAEMTGKKAGVVLIIGPRGDRYFSRLKLLADRYNITAWTVPE